MYLLCASPRLLEHSTQIPPQSQTLFIVTFGIGINGYSALSFCDEAQWYLLLFSFHPECLNNLCVREDCYGMRTMASAMPLTSLDIIFREAIATRVAYLLGLMLQVCLSLNTNPRKEVSLSSVGVSFLYPFLWQAHSQCFFHEDPAYASLDEANHISLLSAASLKEQSALRNQDS